MWRSVFVVYIHIECQFNKNSLLQCYFLAILPAEKPLNGDHIKLFIIIMRQIIAIIKFLKSSFLDIDECAMGSHQCSQNCTNTQGSYFCSCQPGYDLSSIDQVTCQSMCTSLLFIILYSRLETSIIRNLFNSKPL